jgi:GT2 family glycosyltransferase
MSFLVTVPFFGKDDGLQMLFPSLGIAYPGLSALQKTVNIFPFEYGEVLVRNNNIENVGFTRACNDGLRASLKRGHDFTWITGDDMVIPNLKLIVESATEEFRLHPKTGIIGLQIRDLEDPDHIYHGGTLQSYPNGLHKSGHVSRGDFQARSLERWVPGGSMIVKKECLQEIGMMDERFFLICSDSDYSFRARASGFDVVHLPVPILHKSGGLSQNPSQEQLERLTRDIQQFEKKWLSGGLFRELEGEIV